MNEEAGSRKQGRNERVGIVACFPVGMALALMAHVAEAQGTRPDTTRPPTLGAVVIVAERSATPIEQSTAAVTRLTAADLARLPNASLVDVFRSVPGIAVVNFDGLGRDPQLMVRGFYGGGEAEYVVVMVDGRNVNLEHNGTVAWETLPPLSAIESIEIVRGSASAMHGDAAVGGVINIVTRRAVEPGARWRVGAESFGGLAASADIGHTLADRPFDAYVGFDHTDGFRDNSGRASAAARASWRYTSMWRASARFNWRDFEEPGPLLERLIGDGSESDPRFQFDGGNDKEWGANVDYDAWLGAGGTLHTTFRLGGRNATLVRTLPLTPDFGDTRERRLKTYDAGVSTQADLNPTILPFGERFSLGLNADIGTIDSRYFSGIEQGEHNLDAGGDGSRIALGMFAHLVTTMNEEKVRWTFGLRMDYLNDAFNQDGGEEFNESHFALSPKVGVNLRYAEGPRSSGHAWFSISRTFKTPTLDQLFDQRPIPVPFPPFSLTTSNPDLNSQFGTSLEAGAYHDISLDNGRLSLTLTTYQIEMRDELDFDVQTLKYVNIGRSRHRGLETGVSYWLGSGSAFVSLALQDAVAREGDNSGNRLKAIPGQVLTAGATYSPVRIGTFSLAVTSNANMWIDDANTQRIPSWTRVDAQFSRVVSAVEVILGARNLFDKRINSTGFLDPSGSGEAYFYPAAGRVITLGIRHGR